MNDKALEVLEFERVKKRLAEFALSYLGVAQIENLVVSTDERRILQLMTETVEAKALVSQSGSVPIPTLEGMSHVTQMLGKSFVFTEPDFVAVEQFIRSTQQLQQYLRRKLEIAPRLCGTAEGLSALEFLFDEIHRCILYGEIATDASDGLRRVRKRLAIAEDRLRRKLDTALKKYRKHLQESIVMQRNGQSVIAVKRDSKRLVPGRLVDESGSGQTIFIQPEDCYELQQEIESIRAEEEQEKYKILCALSDLVDRHSVEIQSNLEIIGYLDFVTARGKYAKAINGQPVRVNKQGQIAMIAGRHPLLPKDSVPIDFTIGRNYQALVITGPNTGGKTVTLKTVGLLTLMVQSGLLVPVAPGSEFAIFHNVLADIGDGQSLDESLSTFSAHIRSVIDVLNSADDHTLVLLDELAAGTDPGEGVGLSIAVLEQLYNRGTTIVATTHFNEIKQFASSAPGFENARMEFDLDSLEPLYRLTIGKPGHSYALQISQKLGLPHNIIQRAQQLTADINVVHRGDSAHAPEKPNVPDTSDGSLKDGAKGASKGNPNEMLHGSEKSKANAAVFRANSETLDDPNGDDVVRANTTAETPSRPYQVGDRVWVASLKRSAIVYSTPDDRGNMVVMMKKQKTTINQKRVSPYLSRDELYPEDYNLDIVLETKEVRKKRKMLSKRYVKGLSIDFPPDPPK